MHSCILLYEIRRKNRRKQTHLVPHALTHFLQVDALGHNKDLPAAETGRDGDEDGRTTVVDQS